MADPIYPDVNGVRYDFSSIKIDLDGGLKLQGIKEINYSHGLEPTDVEGASAEPIGRTRGKYSREASMTLYEWEWKILRDRFGDGYLEKVFTISVTYADDGQPTITDQILGCRIKKVDKARATGGDAAEVKLDLHCMKIIEGGKKPLKAMRV